MHDPEVRLRDVGGSHDKHWRFEAADGRTIQLSLTTTFEPGRSLVRGRQRFEDANSGDRIADLLLCFRLTSHDEFRSLVERFAFGVKALYGDYNYGRYTPGQCDSMVWVLERPSG